MGESEGRLGPSHVETVVCSEGGMTSGWSMPESAGPNGWSGPLLIQQQPAQRGTKFQNVKIYRYILYTDSENSHPLFMLPGLHGLCHVTV